MPSRTETLAALAATTFDVLIIGGGITGAGVARDAAMRGLRVALVEQDDFASGTSSRSSRLVHGGVRYLEHGQLHMVFESSRERRTLLRIAPHLVRPLAFTWPVYRGARVPRWKLGVGLALYDALALFRNVGRHARLAARDVLALEPHLRAAELRGGARYWDAATDDVRLTLANVRAAVESGAVVANHARVVALLRAGGRVTGARVVDALTGHAIEISARVVVNASGPWSDRVEALARTTVQSGVRGSKGVHVCVPRARVANAAAITVTAPQDGRVMFVLPAGDFTIIGTTDTYDAVAPEEVRANEGDVTYLLAAANYYFPKAKLARTDVVSAWAGIRPLAVGTGGANEPGSASREHAIAETAPGLIRVTGGKLTTYRAMSAEIADRVQGVLGAGVRRAATDALALPGGDVADYAAEITAVAREVGDAAVATRLVHAHGSAWRAVWALAAADSALREPIVAGRPYLMAELRYAVDREMACTLGDLLIRRVPVAFETRDNGRSAARAIAPVVSRWLGVDEKAAVAAYDAEVTRIFSVDR